MIQQFLKDLNQGDRTVFSICSDPSGHTLERVRSSELLRYQRHWAALFRQRSEEVVAVFGHLNPSMIAAWLAAAGVGKRPVFISHPSRKVSADDYARRLENYRHRFGPCLFVGEPSDRAFCPGLLTDRERSAAEPDDGEIPVGTPDGDHRPLFLQCGSGTTGLQKAVAITHRQLSAQIEHYRRELALDPERDRIVSWLPLYHDMGLVAAFLLPLLTGTPVIYLDPFQWAANPEWLLRVLERHRGTLCWLPNFAFSFLGRQAGDYDLGHVRSFINCSEPVSLGAFTRFLSSHPVRADQLSVCYALAEQVFAATQTPVGRAPGALLVDRAALQRRQVRPLGRLHLETNPSPPPDTAAVVFSCGKPLPMVEVHIEAAAGEAVGEVWLRGPCTVDGYYQQPAITRDGWLATGDLGFLQDGELYLTGRRRDIIIHNGKNLHPQDLEATVNDHLLVHPGRVAAIGHRQGELESESVLILFEPKRPLTIAERQRLAGEIRERLDLLFDVPSEVVAVPRRWLRKTSSGKMARRANLEKFLAADSTCLHLCGDSHVRLFWTAKNSHINQFDRLRAHWLGLLWADNWQRALPFFIDLIPRLNDRDILVIQAGEPECRTLFANVADPLARIEQSVAGYRQFFLTLRKLWKGRLAYMTGIPTHPHNIDNGDPTWPITGDPRARYRYQALFYQRMAALCSELVIHFLDVCTPFLGADGYLDAARLADRSHLHPHYRDQFIHLLENRFGYLNTRPNRSDDEDPVWDGGYEHYLTLCQKKIREIALLGGEPDWDRLVSSGTLDSLSIVALVAMLERVFSFRIDPATIRREDFESLSTLYQRYGPQRTVDARPLSNPTGDQSATRSNSSTTF